SAARGATLPASDQLGEAGAAPDYPLYSQIPLGVIRLLQGRPEEAREVLAALAKDFPGLPLIDAPLAWAAAEAGRFDEARRTLDSFAKYRFTGLSWTSDFNPISAYTHMLQDTLTQVSVVA